MGVQHLHLLRKHLYHRLLPQDQFVSGLVLVENDGLYQVNMKNVDLFPSCYFFKLTSFAVLAFLWWKAGATLHCGARASHCGGFSYSSSQALEPRLALAALRHVGLSQASLGTLFFFYLRTTL